jgi:excisionase family DNA binding protein
MKKGKKPALSNEPQSEMMTVYEVAEYLHCHSITVYRLIHQKVLPGFRLSRGNDCGVSAPKSIGGPQHV